MKKLICLFGVSNVGKSTIAQILEDELGFHHVTAIDKWKRFLEQVYQLPFRSLNTQEGKQAEIGNTTAGKLLEDSYHFWAERDAEFGSNCLEATLNETFQENDNPDILVESIRFPSEVARIKKFAQEKGYTLIGFVIKAPQRAIIKDTDKLVGVCMTRFPRHAPLISINNAGRPVEESAADVADWLEAFDSQLTDNTEEFLEEIFEGSDD